MSTPRITSSRAQQIITMQAITMQAITMQAITMRNILLPPKVFFCQIAPMIPLMNLINPATLRP
ncbi:MAG: hypothetical protein HC818_04440 [Synechococcaceae cyanobacterium RM1_1_27]|nr:hypothetical protein [Synechococcaceae cyanobacterium RM1_1_27]